MGYYTTLTSSDVEIPADKLDEAYKALCELNNRNDLKRYGQFPHPSGVRPDVPHPEASFGGVPWNYHETCRDLDAILTELGFGCELTPSNGLWVAEYDHKSRDEAHFFDALAPYIPDGQSMEWRGEDGSLYQWVFEGGKRTEKEGIVQWV